MPGPLVGNRWIVRYLRAATGVWLVIAIVYWLRPINISARDLTPFGCGSVASPVAGELVEYACSLPLQRVRLTVLALFVATALLLVLAETVRSRPAFGTWLLGLGVAAPLGVPVVSLSCVRIVHQVSASTADGTVIGCGSALQAASDQISSALCAQLVETQRVESLGGIAVGLALLLGGAYMTHALPRSEWESDV